MAATTTNLGFIDTPLTDENIATLPFDGQYGDDTGSRVEGYVRMALDELTAPDERGLVYDIEAKVIGNRSRWELEDVSYAPSSVDEEKNIVLRVNGVVFPR